MLKMIENHDPPASGFAISSWNPDGVATLDASGLDPRSALEAALRGTLALALGSAPVHAEADRASPIRGEGEDLAALFADMVDELLDQIAEFGHGLHDLTVDGVLRREGGGYIAWGYATGTLAPAAATAIPRIDAVPVVNEDGQHVTIQVTFRRS